MDSDGSRTLQTASLALHYVSKVKPDQARSATSSLIIAMSGDHLQRKCVRLRRYQTDLTPLQDVDRAAKLSERGNLIEDSVTKIVGGSEVSRVDPVGDDRSEPVDAPGKNRAGSGIAKGLRVGRGHFDKVANESVGALRSGHRYDTLEET